MTYMAYVTDSLHLAGQNKYLGHKWYDTVRPKVHEDVDAAEVVADVASRAGLVIA